MILHAYISIVQLGAHQAWPAGICDPPSLLGPDKKGRSSSDKSEYIGLRKGADIIRERRSRCWELGGEPNPAQCIEEMVQS